MASQRSESIDVLTRLRESVASGDWTQAESMAAQIRHYPVPATREQIGQYLDELKQTLIACKIRRANSKAALARLRAAAGFQSSIDETSSKRQNSAVSTGF